MIFIFFDDSFDDVNILYSTVVSLFKGTSEWYEINVVDGGFTHRKGVHGKKFGCIPTVVLKT